MGQTSHILKSALRNRRGGVLVLGALVLVVAFAFVAFSIDVGYISLAKNQLQNAADAAALAGALELDEGAATVPAAAAAVAAENVAGGVAVEVRDSDVEIGLWDEDAALFVPLTGAAVSSADAVRVTCWKRADRSNDLKLFFAPMVGMGRTDVMATATARLRNYRCALLIGLNGVSLTGSSSTDSYNSALGAYNGSGAGTRGHVCSNSNIQMGGAACINGDAHPGPGCDVTGRARVTGTIEPLEKPLIYRPVDASAAILVNDNASIPLTSIGRNPLSVAGIFTLTSSETLELPPGTYYFASLKIDSSTSLFINGPTIIYVAGLCDFSGSSMINRTQIPSDLQLFPMGAACRIEGSADLYAVIYCPSTRVEVAGSGDIFGAIIAGELVLRGTGDLHADEAIKYDYIRAGSFRASLVE